MDTKIKVKPLAPQDARSLTPQDAHLYRLYGHMPSPTLRFSKILNKERKYFDSGDYALSKAGKADLGPVGQLHPDPDHIPHPRDPTCYMGFTPSKSRTSSFSFPIETADKLNSTVEHT